MSDSNSLVYFSNIVILILIIAAFKGAKNLFPLRWARYSIPNVLNKLHLPWKEKVMDWKMFSSTMHNW